MVHQSLSFLQCCLKTWCFYSVFFVLQFGRLELAQGSIYLHYISVMKTYLHHGYCTKLEIIFPCFHKIPFLFFNKELVTFDYEWSYKGIEGQNHKCCCLVCPFAYSAIYIFQLRIHILHHLYPNPWYEIVALFCNSKPKPGFIKYVRIWILQDQ